MPWTPPPEEQLRLLGRAHRLNTAALVAFGMVVLAAGVAAILQPDRWWAFLIPLVLIAIQSTNTLRRRRKILAARSRIEAELHQDHTSSATPEGR